MYISSPESPLNLRLIFSVSCLTFLITHTHTHTFKKWIEPPNSVIVTVFSASLMSYHPPSGDLAYNPRIITKFSFLKSCSQQ